MASIHTPDRAEEAAISKDSILIRLTSKYLRAKQCIPLLWKRFVMPAVKAKLAGKPIPQVHCSEQTLDIELQTVVDDDIDRKYVMQLLRRYDYIRLNADGHYTAGTRLWTEVDAGRMLVTVKNRQ